MLNNLTNFFNLIKGRLIKTQLEDSDLIAVGTKQSPALGDYKPTAILFSDLKAQLAVSSAGAVNYAKVAYVDRVNGNDLTGVRSITLEPRSSSKTSLTSPGMIFNSTSGGDRFIGRPGGGSWKGSIDMTAI